MHSFEKKRKHMFPFNQLNPGPKILENDRSKD